MTGVPKEAPASAVAEQAGYVLGEESGPSLARAAVPLAGVIGTYGVFSAFMSNTSSLFLASAVGAGPLLIGLFFAVRGAVTLVVNLAVGRWSDRLPDRRLLIGIGGAAGALSGLCMAVLRGYLPVLVTGSVFFSISAVTFAQAFAYSNELARARGLQVTRFMAWMRAVFSASWVIGPPAGLFILTRYGFGPLYVVTGCLSLASGVIGRWGLSRMPAAHSPADVAPAAARGAPRAPRRDSRGGTRSSMAALPARTWLLLGVVVVLGLVNQMYSIDIALYVTRDLHLSAQLVGWMAGAGAILEIPIMIAAGRIAERIGKPRVVLAAAAGAAVFFCLLPLARSTAWLLGLQALNAAWTAVAMSVPMVMVQEETPGGIGASSALYSSAFMSAALLAGAITGVTAAAVGYGNVFWVCAGLSVVAVALLLYRMAGSGGALRGEPE